MANGGAPEGLVDFAEHQTAGRGQRGNLRESPAGGLLRSILLRPNVAVQDSARLVDWAAKGIAWTVENACLCKATTKPPNDIYIDGRKVAGVLVEMRAQPGAPHLAVAGIARFKVHQMPKHFSGEFATAQSRLPSFSAAPSSARPWQPPC